MRLPSPTSSRPWSYGSIGGNGGTDPSSPTPRLADKMRHIHEGRKVLLTITTADSRMLSIAGVRIEEVVDYEVVFPRLGPGLIEVARGG